MTVADELQAAIGTHQSGNLTEARKAYQAILAESPDQPDALHFLGLLTFQEGDADTAIGLIRKSLEINSTNASACNNLGNIYFSLEKADEAYDAYSSAIKIEPDHTESWSNIGVLLRRARQMDDAIEVLMRVTEKAPDNLKAWHNLGLTYLLDKQLEKAADAFETCLDICNEQRNPGLVWHSRVLDALGRKERAISHLVAYLKARPDDPTAVYQLAALRGEDVARAPDNYVRAHFDSFSESFDEVLAGLNYRAPTLVAEEVATTFEGRGTLPDVIDLGCGTGLCGPLIRQHCDRLTGIDLSVGMLRRAVKREVYDYLIEGELVAFLQQTAPICFDLAVCVDTLCYFGRLEEFFQALGTALKPGGRMIATVEEMMAGDGTGHEIMATGRHRHSEAYLRTVSEAAGLDFGPVRREVLREELGTHVDGLVFTVQRPAATE